MQEKLSIKVYANNDDATIVIKEPIHIKDCWGFAIYKKHQGETDMEAEPLPTSVGFEGDLHIDGEMRPSTEWPIQKYIWIDYFVSNGDVVAYKIIPMIKSENGLIKDLTHASEWSDFVKIGNTNEAGAYFNRGIVSSQFLSRRLNSIPEKDRTKKLKEILIDEKSEIRSFMGGDLMLAIYRLLDEAREDNSLRIYAALYELNDPVLIEKLNSIGKRANIILANGAFRNEEKDPEKEAADKLTQVNLTRRIVSTPHFAHNKFLVVTQITGSVEAPVKVLTGSTNWTVNGLCTQVNNSLIIKDTEVVKYYKKEWEVMHEDCSSDGKALYGQNFNEYNETVKENIDNNIRTYFTPVPNEIDMDEVDKYIKGAQKGILFLMFKPGIESKSRLFYDTIKEMAKNRELLVNGVINSDPGGNDNPTISFLHKNVFQQGDLDVALPKSLNNPFEFWVEELGPRSVTIHSKTILIDPFSENPILITGSHNMGNKASKSNDDNLNIIIGDKKLAQSYAIHMMSIYHHYRWRFYRSKESAKPKWNGNKKSDIWQQWYFTGEKLKEIKFWTE